MPGQRRRGGGVVAGRADIAGHLHEGQPRTGHQVRITTTTQFCCRLPLLQAQSLILLFGLLHRSSQRLLTNTLKTAKKLGQGELIVYAQKWTGFFRETYTTAHSHFSSLPPSHHEHMLPSDATPKSPVTLTSFADLAAFIGYPPPHCTSFPAGRTTPHRATPRHNSTQLNIPPPPPLVPAEATIIRWASPWPVL